MKIIIIIIIIINENEEPTLQGFVHVTSKRKHYFPYSQKGELHHNVIVPEYFC